jgi:DNA adenine methylase
MSLSRVSTSQGPATSEAFGTPPGRQPAVPSTAGEPPLLEGIRKPLRLASLSPLRYPESKRKMIPGIRQLIDAKEPPAQAVR